MGNAVSYETRKDEAENLRKILRSRGIGPDQEKAYAVFAREARVPGGKSLLSQHLSCERPISAASGKVYAKALNCQLREISQRLADLINEPLAAQQDISGVTYNVVRVNFEDDRIRRVIDLMQSTDAEGRIKCLEAVKWALKDHMPAKKGQA